MYRPKAFDIPDVDAMQDIIDGSGPAHLVSVSSGALVTSVVPMILDRSRGELGTLIGHLARPNPHWRDVDPMIDAVAIFSGPDAYVSPDFYVTKHETGKVVPTWNYVAINAYGPLAVHDDRDFVLDVVSRLTDRHEGRRSRPWAITDAPADYIESMLRGIVGIEIPISRLEGKSKLSQNKPAADVEGVIVGLSTGTEAERRVAAMMSAE